jgi:hypothetical protein
VLWSSAAFAQTQVGVRAGVSGDPGQFVFGGHVETQPLIPHLSFRPNVEIGVGDGSTLLAINFEFVYSIRPDAKPWRVYLGAGPAAVVRWAHDHGGTDGGGGLNFLIGLQHDRGLFAEFKVGAIDSPSARFTVGYAFR